MWPDLIQKAKDGGLDAIETYVFWDAHEPQRRQVLHIYFGSDSIFVLQVYCNIFVITVQF